MKKQKKCYSCAYVQRPESGENMHCNYAFVEQRTRVKQVYEMLGIDHMTDEARAMLSGYKCPFYAKGQGKTPGAERIRRIESEWEKKEQRRKRIQDELMGRVPMKVKKPQSKFDWGLAKKMHERGKNAQEIAEALGCSRATVQNWKRANGLADPTKGNKPQYDWRLAQYMWDQGESDRAIAQALGCSKGAVDTWKHKNGLKRRDAKAAGG